MLVYFTLAVDVQIYSGFFSSTQHPHCVKNIDSLRTKRREVESISFRHGVASCRFVLPYERVFCLYTLRVVKWMIMPVAAAAVVAVGFIGLAVCLTIICCGVVCLRR